MTAIFATPFAPTVARPGPQRRSRACALLLAALGLAACGGISVHHDDPDAGPELDGTGGSSSAGRSNGGGQHVSATSDERTTCIDVCQTCNGTTAASCGAFCETVLNSAAQAGCATALANLLRCQETTGSGCSVHACPEQNNVLAVCVLDYCDNHANDAVCVEPL